MSEDKGRIEITGYSMDLVELMGEIEDVIYKHTKPGKIHIASVAGILELIKQNMLYDLIISKGAY